MAAQDWIEKLETMNWPVDGTLPHWRHVAIVAADCLAFRIIGPFSKPRRANRPPHPHLGVDDGQCGNFK
jgi:hypothetical protein